MFLYQYDIIVTMDQLIPSDIREIRGYLRDMQNLLLDPSHGLTDKEHHDMCECYLLFRQALIDREREQQVTLDAMVAASLPCRLDQLNSTMLIHRSLRCISWINFD